MLQAAATADGIVAGSDTVAQQVHDRLAVPAARIRVVPPCIDTTRFDPARRYQRPDDLPAGPIAIAVQSSFNTDKGLHRLIEAFSLTPHRGNCRLVVIGDDDDPRRRNRSRLEQQVQNLELGDTVVFAGTRPNQDLPAYLDHTDVFVDPRASGHASSSLAEAMCMARPVIVSDPAQPLIDDQRTGIVAETPREVALAISSLLCSREQRVQLGAQARQQVLSSSDGRGYPQVVSEFLTAITELVARR